MKRLSKRQVVMLHEQLICETGGSTGIRDDGLLESALEAPFQEFGGVSVYPSVQQLKIIPLWMETSGSAHTPCLCFWN